MDTLHLPYNTDPWANHRLPAPYSPYAEEVAQCGAEEADRANRRFRAWQRKQANSDIRHNMVGSPQIVHSEHTATACR